MVPGSTLMYGSSLHIVTRRPRHLRSRPSEEAVRPFPSELETPPVTKMNLLTPPSGRRAVPGMIGALGHDNRRGVTAWWTSPRRDVEQLARVRTRRVAPGVAREHARELGHPLLALHRGRRRDRPALRRPFHHADL